MLSIHPVENIQATIPVRYFTLDEANQLLVGLRPHLEITALFHRKLKKILTDISQGKKREELQRKATLVRAEIEKTLNVVRSKGVEVSTGSPGTLDFPALRNGKRVYLSWRRGDDSISWWRPMFAPKPHRQIVDSDLVCWEWRN